MNLPQARTTDIIEQETDKELLVYDLRINKAYNLNETSTLVYKACGGEISFDELKRKYQLTDDLVYLALDELKSKSLLATDYDSPFNGLSRREVIKRVGLASIIALPLISTLIAPMAANAASVCATGTGPGQLGASGSGSGQRCSCPTRTNAGTTCSYGTGSGGAANTYCRTGCTCTSTSTSATCTGGQAPCLGICG